MLVSGESGTKERSSHNQKWQAKVSSGFDKLLALASTQLTHANKDYKSHQEKKMKEDMAKCGKFSSHPKSIDKFSDLCKSSKDQCLSQKSIFNDHPRANLSQSDAHKSANSKPSNTNRSRKGPRTPENTPPRTPSNSPDRRVLESPYFQSHSPISSAESISSNRSSLSPPYISPARGSSKDRSRSTSPYSSRASSVERQPEKFSSRKSGSSHESENHKKMHEKERWQIKSKSDMYQRSWSKDQDLLKIKNLLVHGKNKKDPSGAEPASVSSVVGTREMMGQLDFMSQQAKDVLAHAQNGYSVVMTPSPLHAIYVPTAGVCSQPPLVTQSLSSKASSVNYSVASACAPALSANPILNFTIPPPNFNMPPPHPSSNTVNMSQMMSSQQVQPMQLPDVTVPPPNMVSVASFLPSSNLQSCPPQLEPAVPSNHVYRQSTQSHPPPLPPTVASASSFNNIVQSQLYRGNQKTLSSGAATHQLDYRVPQHCALPATGSNSYYPGI